jgi:hypothetical protein
MGGATGGGMGRWRAGWPARSREAGGDEGGGRLREVEGRRGKGTVPIPPLSSSSASEPLSSFLLLSPSSHHVLYFVFQFVLNLISGIGKKLMDFTCICVLIW